MVKIDKEQILGAICGMAVVMILIKWLSPEIKIGTIVLLLVKSQIGLYEIHSLWSRLRRVKECKQIVKK